MPKPTSKSPETVAAQVAAFGAERVARSHESVYVPNRIGSLAIGDTLHAVDRSTKIDASYGEYVDYLRSVGGSGHESIRGRKELLERYNLEFKAIADQLHDQMMNPEVVKNGSSLLGGGSSSSVYRVTHDGQNYALRMPRDEVSRPSMVDRHMAGAILGKGIPHLEQIVAASYEDGVTVAEIMPGKTMGKDMTIDDMRSVTDEHLEELVDTLIATHEAGIEVDFASSANFLYDRDEGFGIIDYYAADTGPHKIDQAVGNVVGGVADIIMSAGISDRNYPDLSPESFKEDAEQLSVNLGVLQRYRVAAHDKLAGEDLEVALEDIDLMIGYYQEIIAHYSDPAWVKEKLADEAAQHGRGLNLAIR